MKNLILISILTTIALNFNAQCSITGFVTDDSNRPMPGSEVHVEGEQAGKTDSNGRFEIAVPCDTSYTIVTTRLGYEVSYFGINSCAVIDEDIEIVLNPQIPVIRMTNYHGCCSPPVAYSAVAENEKKQKRQERRARRLANR